MKTLAPEISLADYFDQEIQAETRSEYISGEIIPMTGGTPTHNTIVANLLVAIYAALQQQPYRVFVTDQRLWIPDRRVATYPDIMVIAEPIQLMEGRRDTVINPIFLAEVLSDSTEAYDRGDKFAAYRTIPTFREYLLVSQEMMSVEHFYKEGDRWIFTAYEGDAMISLTSLKVTIPTIALYNRINFEPKP